MVAQLAVRLGEGGGVGQRDGGGQLDGAAEVARASAVQALDHDHKGREPCGLAGGARVGRRAFAWGGGLGLGLGLGVSGKGKVLTPLSEWP